MSAKERFVYFLDYKGSNRNKFYQQSGMSMGTLDKKGGLSEDSLLKICNVYPELSLDWLLLGNGEMIRPEFTQNVSMETAPQPDDGGVQGGSIPDLIKLASEQHKTIDRLTYIIDHLTIKK